jgi:hypothetical protein
MGVSTDGILAFGIAYDEDCEFFSQDDFDLEDMLAEEAGLREPDHEDYKRQDWKDYWEAKRATAEGAAISHVVHCSYDYPMHILAVRRLSFSARRGYPVEIDMTLQPTDDERDALKNFCEKHGLEWSEPKWLLASLWG